MDVFWAILLVLLAGAAGGFVNVFIGDSGLHKPRVENDVFQPGFLGTVLVGALGRDKSHDHLRRRTAHQLFDR